LHTSLSTTKQNLLTNSHTIFRLDTEGSNILILNCGIKISVYIFASDGGFFVQIHVGVDQLKTLLLHNLGPTVGLVWNQVRSRTAGFVKHPSLLVEYWRRLGYLSIVCWI